jgi:hypothetical protein
MATKGKLGLSSKEINTPLLQGLEFLCQTFGCELDAWERKAYERTLKGINGGVLAEAAQLLVDEAAAGRKFYPVPKAPDWKAACAKVIAKRQHAARMLHLADCDHSSQWIENEKGQLERCPCWNRLQYALTTIGAIALPPAPGEPVVFEMPPIEGPTS